jgi:hypothetical protein
VSDEPYIPPPITEEQWIRILGGRKVRYLVNIEQQAWAGSARRALHELRARRQFGRGSVARLVHAAPLHDVERLPGALPGIREQQGRTECSAAGAGRNRKRSGPSAN